MKKLLIFVDSDDYLVIARIRKEFLEHNYTFLSNSGIEIYECDEDNSIKRVK
jgi:hypothetical protein